MEPASAILLGAAILACTIAAIAGILRGRRGQLSHPAPVAPSKLEERVAVLELERVRFINEMNGLLEQCDEILERTEAKRRRVQRQQQNAEGAPGSTQGEQPELMASPRDRDAAKADVARRFHAVG